MSKYNSEETLPTLPHHQEWYHLSQPTTAETIITLARDILKQRLVQGEKIYNRQQAMDFFRLQLGNLEHEEFWCLFLTTQMQVIQLEKMFRGTVDRTYVIPREVVKSALLCNAKHVIIVHNHPSGSLNASQSDHAITERLSDALKLVEINLADHLIITHEDGVSFKQQGYL